jgi:hypothetical protein
MAEHDKKVLVQAVAMIARFMKEYEVSFEKAVECAHGFTGINKTALIKAWRDKHKEEK